MTVGVKTLVECVNQSIGCLSCDPLKTLQLSGVNQDFDTGFVYSVANCSLLPPAAANKGRWIFLQDVCTYRWSDGTSWSTNFKSIQTRQVWSWGCNSGGRLGDNTIINRSSPVSVVGGLINWCQISAGSEHSHAIGIDGVAWAWGCGSCGRLGDNTTINKSSPISVVGGFTDWCQIAAGSFHSVGLRTNGTIWAWGLNSGGILGDNTTVLKSSPASLVGGFADWCQVSAGGMSLGLRTNCSLWAWGSNGTGTIGDNTTIAKSSPVSVIGGFTDWCQVSAGANHNVALRTNGTIWAWGCNGNGQIGDNTTVNKSSPVSIVGGFTDWCQVSAGTNLSFGIRTNGTLWGWGCSQFGGVGDGTCGISSRPSPVSVVGGFTDWCSVSAGNQQSVAIRTNGTIWAWGLGSGTLGDNTGVGKASPVSVVGGFTNWYRVSAGGAHSLALLNTSTKGF